MTEVTCTTKFTTVNQKVFSTGHTDVQFIDPGTHRSFQKRYWAQLSCSRLIERGLPGADLAAEYVYGNTSGIFLRALLNSQAL